eukprot:TRINITY_DN5072_c0_g1_i8.p3 TRINITY_DN5072_c0_g1~~TRINITY_DN5072_c0_g1_i8.p3  ORF type:complete len:184 (+),score=10.42 TRINITY_DN5072_c0_g1_i8:1045-1596(+)
MEWLAENGWSPAGAKGVEGIDVRDVTTWDQNLIFGPSSLSLFSRIKAQYESKVANPRTKANHRDHERRVALRVISKLISAFPALPTQPLNRMRVKEAIQTLIDRLESQLVAEAHDPKAGLQYEAKCWKTKMSSRNEAFYEDLEDEVAKQADKRSEKQREKDAARTAQKRRHRAERDGDKRLRR